ncbi:hypothetical protein EB796_006494 [Bugula neritina]|uniref:Uncharacterized protein n=1 Tax=Bugula neritina TaxID=10212 RepID=A0A7J7K973_BUGNE|nr:hypothetical protein EB796_006494 [Bugula neritina]
MCPEEGLCSHVLPLNPLNNGEGSRVQDDQSEELERPEAHSGSRAVHSDNLGGHDLNGHANTEENTSIAGVEETTHTPVDDEAILSMLDYLLNHKSPV